METRIPLYTIVTKAIRFSLHAMDTTETRIPLHAVVEILVEDLLSTMPRTVISKLGRLSVPVIQWPPVSEKSCLVGLVISEVIENCVLTVR